MKSCWLLGRIRKMNHVMILIWTSFQCTGGDNIYTQTATRYGIMRKILRIGRSSCQGERKRQEAGHSQECEEGKGEMGRVLMRTGLQLSLGRHRDLYIPGSLGILYSLLWKCRYLRRCAKIKTIIITFPVFLKR